MTDQEIISKINEVFVEEFEANVEDIKLEAMLMQTLDLDSLDLVDVVVLIESNFGILLKGPDFLDVKTFQDFYSLIIRKMNEEESK